MESIGLFGRKTVLELGEGGIAGVELDHFDAFEDRLVGPLALALGEFLAYTDWGIALSEQIMAGHPGAARPMQAYMP